MAAVVYCSTDPEARFYELVEEPSAKVLVLGEQQDQWTTLTLDYFSKAGVSVFFLPWAKMPEIRLQLSLVRYPVIQMWASKKMLREVTGHHEESLASIAKSFFR